MTSIHRDNNKLDRIYVSDDGYSDVKAMKSIATSDRMAIVAYTGEPVKKSASEGEPSSSGITRQINTLTFYGSDAVDGA